MSIESHPELKEQLRREAARAGGIPFSRFMEQALYHPVHGYYASGRAVVGRGGDFFTSVSVGGVFGLLIARRIARWWREEGEPGTWRLIEQGAHHGQLMGDVLDHLPEACKSGMRVDIIEPFPALQEQQHRLLGTRRESITWNTGLDTMPPFDGRNVYFANELLDAFPVERIVREDGHWLSHTVVDDPSAPSGFAWGKAPVPDEWREFLPGPGMSWPDGYVTEIRPGLRNWARQLRQAIPHGLVLLIDYGFEESDYFHPSRNDGTLRTYHKHTAPDNPFTGIGHCDITAHVNWTSVTRQLVSEGFALDGPADQGRWLTRTGRDWLLELEGTPDPAVGKWLRQFQTLTHPQHLGGKFQVLEAQV